MPLLQAFVGMGLLLLTTAGLAVDRQAPTDTPPSNQVPIIIWTLNNARFVDFGQLVETSGNQMLTGLQIEANAIASPDNTSFTEGIFRLTITGFSPRPDLPGGMTGRWYLRGSWIITDPKIGPTRADSAIITGDFAAEFDAYPLADLPGLTFPVRLTSPSSDRQRRFIRGELSFTDKREGAITMLPDRTTDRIASR